MVYVRRIGTRIYIGVWVQRRFDLLGVDDVKFSPLDEKFCKGDGVRDVLLFV